MGIGNRPYQPHPYLYDPVIVEPGPEGPVNPGPAQPAAAMPAPANPEHQGVRIVRVDGPLHPPLPQQYSAQPLHWVFRKPPQLKAKPEVKLEVKTEPDQGPAEYIEPIDDENASSA
jgi:hypothetical protein